MKKILFLFVIVLVLPAIAKGQIKNDVVTLVVSGTGKTKTEATQAALRSGIEQAYGTFLSSNTSIINDEIEKDEIMTLSSGNIIKYKELSCKTLLTGDIYITLEEIVTLSKLADFANSKGAEIEYSGNAFAMNMRLKQFNKTSEEKIISNLFYTLESLYKKGFDYTLIVSEPNVDGEIKCNIDAKLNNNGKNAEELLYSTLDNISLKKKDIEEYQKVDIKTFSICFLQEHRVYTFRSEKTMDEIKRFFNYTYPKCVLGFTIDTGVSKSSIDLVSVDAEGLKDFHYDNGEQNQGVQLFRRYVSSFFSDSGAAQRFDSVDLVHINISVDRRKLNNIMPFDFNSYTKKMEDMPYALYNTSYHIYHTNAENCLALYPQGKHIVNLYLKIPMDEIMKISNIKIYPNE